MSRLLYLMRKLVADLGGYGMLYNWFCTQEQAAVEYGYLYNWYSISDSRNICSDGFHVPTRTEITTLQTYLGGESVAGGKLKEAGLTNWSSPNSGATNETRFNARGTGNRGQSGTFDQIHVVTRIWTSTSYNTTFKYYGLLTSYDALFPITNTNVLVGNSIRPMKDSTTLTNGQTGTYVDPSGIIYPTICIGTQEWVACNIMTKHYRNGDVIPEVTDNTAWAALTTGARCSYNNIESNAGTTKKLSSSDDWVVPNNTQRTTLRVYLDAAGSDYVNVAGSKMKEIGLTYWNTPNTGATNEVGFNGRGTGVRGTAGNFEAFKNLSTIWTRDSYDATYSWGATLRYNETNFAAALGYKYSGLSIRLLYTGSGTPTTYTGNDGTVYPVVLIGTQRWLAMNLKETKWSDGTDIQNITDNTAWSLLTEAACCDINNDPTLR